MSAGTFAGRALSSELRLAARTRAVLEAEGLVVTAVAVWAMLLALWLPALVAPDTWLALVDGRLVATSGIPHSDPFRGAWTLGRAWTDQQWAGHLALYELARHVGVWAVVSFGAAAVLAGLDRGRARAEAGRDSSQYGAGALVPRDRRAVDGAGAAPKASRSSCSRLCSGCSRSTRAHRRAACSGSYRC